MYVLLTSTKARNVEYNEDVALSVLTQSAHKRSFVFSEK